MKKRIFVCLLVGVITVAIAYLYMNKERDVAASEDMGQPPAISARDAILIDLKDGTILYEKNKDEKAYPASTTKILTGLVALEICEDYSIDLEEKVKIPKEAVGIEGSSLYLKAGQVYTIEELLYGTLLRSGNDGATALAIILGGSMENFVRQMNEKAEKLGCRDSNFVNPTGLHHESHYTTASDLAKISMCAMKNEEFKKIVAAKEWGSYVNKNKTLFQYEGGTGVKIGFTKMSGRTLVASAKRKGVHLIAVVLSDGNWFEDAYSLLDYGFYLRVP